MDLACRIPARIVLFVIAVVVMATIVFTVAASPAMAANGARWPGTRITYFDATKDKDAVRRAVAAWNNTGIRMRFVRTFNRKRANIVIRNSHEVPGGCGTGLATLGYTYVGQGFVNILHGPASQGQSCGMPGQALVVAHELGHVLGLGHYDGGCALMNSSHTNGVAQTECVPGDTVFDHVAQWRCRIIEPHDARRALRMYGGKLRPTRKNPWCDLVPLTATPRPVSIAKSADDPTRLILTVRRPSEPIVPSYLSSDATRTAGVRIFDGSSCATTLTAAQENLHSVDNIDWTVNPGQDQVINFMRSYAQEGHTCFSVFALDRLGRPSLSAATTTIELEPYPDEDELFAQMKLSPRFHRHTTTTAATRPNIRIIDLQGDTVRS